MFISRVDGSRLLDDVDALARIGATSGGGVTRLALTDADKAGRDWLCRSMEAAGLAVRVDDFGNIVGRREGLDDGPALLIGSHIDSVREGGRFDGSLGVLASVEAVRVLNGADVSMRRPVEVVAWTNEEGVRFEPAMLCSGAVSGRFDQSYVYDRTDQDGTRFEEELRRIGYLGKEEHRPQRPAAYLELHVEQGPELEQVGHAVGAVEGIVGITWLEARIEGRADHAGPSAMDSRRDALAAAARLITSVESLAGGTPDAVATVGRLTVEPNVINTIPGRVVMSVDIRHPEAARLEVLVAGLRRSVEEIAGRTGVTIAIDRFWTSEPTPFDADVLAAVRNAGRALNLPIGSLWSRAGHDAKYMQDICPAGMIFVRSRDGLSHSEAEFTAPDDTVAGANVLLGAVCELGQVVRV